MKTKTNKIPLVGPKGRRELLDKIEELEAQIAQQGPLKVKVGQISAMSEEEKAIIKKHVLAGTIFDVILESENNGELARIITVWPSDNSFAVYLCSAEIIELLPY